MQLSKHWQVFNVFLVPVEPDWSFIYRSPGVSEAERNYVVVFSLLITSVSEVLFVIIQPQ